MKRDPLMMGDHPNQYVEKQVTSCFCGSKFCVRCAKGKKVQKQERCHLSRWRRPPTTSEKKKRLWISCLNFATTRVKKYANML